MADAGEACWHDLPRELFERTLHEFLHDSFIASAALRLTCRPWRALVDGAMWFLRPRAVPVPPAQWPWHALTTVDLRDVRPRGVVHDALLVALSSAPRMQTQLTRLHVDGRAVLRGQVSVPYPLPSPAEPHGAQLTLSQASNPG